MRVLYVSETGVNQCHCLTHVGPWVRREMWRQEVAATGGNAEKSELLQLCQGFLLI